MRRYVTVLIAAGSLTACAHMGNTLAQDLAWERWSKCSGVPGINLARITPDGRVFVTYTADHRAAFNQWNDCMIKAAAEQGRQRVGSAAPPPQAEPRPSDAGAASAPAPMPTAPAWNIGDEWAYRYEGPTGSGTYVWSVDREETIDGIPHYVIKTDTREIFYRKADIAFTRETVDGVVVLKSTPSRLRYVSPMRPGQTWEQTVLEERPVARQTSERSDTVTIEAEETITVPGGTFKALKIVVRNRTTGTTRVEAWYSPELKQVVRLRENLDSGLRVRELIMFKLR